MVVAETSTVVTLAQLASLAILGGSLVLFAWGRWRYDVVAVAAMLAVVLAGFVSAEEALGGFGHPAVVTVAAVLVISRVLRNSGMVSVISAYLLPMTRGVVSHVAVLTILVTFASAFMNNVGALALLMPVALATAAKRQRSPSLLLMPLAFGSVLGGVVTMIGTPPNIIIATLRADYGSGPFELFDFTPVGVLVALAGVVFVSLFGWRLIPAQRRKAASLNQTFEISDYIMELRLSKSNLLVGLSIREAAELIGDEVLVVGLVRGKNKALYPSAWRTLRARDLLIVKGDPMVVENAIHRLNLELVVSDAKHVSMDELRLVEATVAPGSPLEGRDNAFIRRRTRRGVRLIAMARQGRAISTRLRSQIFSVGDVLLLQGEADTLDDQLNDLGLLPLAERELTLGQRRRLGRALAVFVAAVAATATGLISVSVAFLGAILAFVLMGMLPARDLYRDIDWPVLVLLGAMLAVGKALHHTGATTAIAEMLVLQTVELGPVAVLTVLMIATMCLSAVINNAATAVIMAPLSAEVAIQLGVNPDTFLMAVAIGASCSFLTPIGHQSNLLVMGPGGYRFGDYWRVGLPLEVVIIVAAVPVLLWVWPL